MYDTSPPSISAAATDGHASLLPRRLGAMALLVLGVGNILGAGVYVISGTAAARYAGPAVMLSFAIAGTACVLVGLCYAELASRYPQSGSAYSYCRVHFGTGMSWAMGWLLILEYSLSASMLGLGFAGYFGSLLQGFGMTLPEAIATPMFTSSINHGHSVLTFGMHVNLVAALAVMTAAVIMTLNLGRSITISATLVVVKLLVLLVFIGIGMMLVDPVNWHPFVPANEGGFRFGWEGVVRAASLLFFAYLGFETVSTAAAETRNPQRNVPIGIIGSLAICTILYVAAGAVLTGLVPFRELGVPDPIALAADRMGKPALAQWVKIGALTGLASVLLANAYGQSRICFAIASDRLLPALFTRRHPRYGSLWQGNLMLGAIAAATAALLPVDLLADMVCLGVTFAFCIVAATLIKVRSNGPKPQNGFRVPLGGIRLRGIWLGTIPVATIGVSIAMVLPVLIQIVARAWRGDILPLSMLCAYLACGLVVYMGYGRRRALIGRRILS